MGANGMVETIPAGAATDAVPASPRVFGIACMLVGVDPDLMAACPARDRDGVRLLAALMMLVWFWQSTVFAAVAHLMLAGPGEIHPGLIGGATLLATIILLIDAYVVMRPSWTGFGYEELRRGGLALRLPVSAHVKGGVFLALRLALSAVVGTLVALFVSLILYGKDIAGQLAADHAARDAPVIVAATRRIDDQIARNADSQADLRSRIAAADRASDDLRRGLTERADPAVASAVAELTGAERVHARAEAEVVRQQQRADAASLARAQRRFDAATAGRAAARVRLTEAERRALSLTQGRDTVLTGQLAALEAQRRQDLDRLAVAEAEHRTMLDGRAATIRTTVAADPAYVAPDDGLLTRLRALKALTADPWVGAVVILLEVFFAGIELAAVFSKLLSFVPATYATRLARADHLRQASTAREIAAALRGSGGEAADLVMPEYADTPGTLMSAGASPSAEPAEAPNAFSTATSAHDGDVPAGSICVFADSEEAGNDQTPPRHGEVVGQPASRLQDGQPRRRRGRPPKVR